MKYLCGQSLQRAAKPPGLMSLAATWNANNPNVTVVHRPIGNEEFFTVIRTGLAGGEP
ncbi:MAG: hypothetical protein M5U28_11190 [Sandaracinaceae bacterium]|nr:hypothetical protein [Sandaracinaceae bacterium]